MEQTLERDRKNLELQINVYRMGMIDKISHCISQNLLCDSAFKVRDYIKECKEVLFEAEMPDNEAAFICFVASKKGRQEYKMRKEQGILYSDGHGGSALHPHYVIYEDALNFMKWFNEKKKLEESVK